VSPKMGMKINIQKTECQFLGERSKKFCLGGKDTNWGKLRTLCIWEGSLIHRRGLTRMWKGELGWRWEHGTGEGTGEGVELQITEQGHKDMHV